MRHGTGMGREWLLLAAAVAAAGCSTDTARMAGASQTRVSISRGALPALGVSATGIAADLTGGPPGFIDPAKVDSLTVTVTTVEVLPDSLLARRHPGEPWGPPGADSVVQRMGGGPFGPGGPGREFGGREHFPFGPGGMRDSLRQRDSTMLRDSLGWGRLDEDWYTLAVAGNGHLDLLHLPTDTASGLQLAVGTVPAGTYGGARLFVSDATIWFNTAIVASDSGVTFQPNVGYPVTIPSGPESGIKTRSGFTIPEGASDVVLVFDVDAAIRHAVATRDGKVLIVPEMGGFGHRR